MRFLPRHFGLIGLMLGLAAATAQEPVSFSGSADRGRTLSYTCLGCHAIANYKNTYPTYSVPKLAGQHPEYIVASLKAYKSSERSHGTMHAHAASMSEQDMADIAAFLAGNRIAVDPNRKSVGTPPQSAQVCVSCHGNDGVGIVPDYPTLAGQHADYLERTMIDYKKGARRNVIMAGQVQTLTDADIRALAEYYARQKPALATVRKSLTALSAR